MARRVFITVAEVSGDRHAAQLVRSLRQLEPDLAVEGFGGPEMAAAGATIHRDTVNKAAMGLRGALRAGEVWRALRWARRHFESSRPDVWVGVDSPSMNFHFARAARERGVPTLQYVAPQLWAWAPWRMKKLRRWVDRVACILPFEEAYFRAHGVNAAFVGHPLFDELPAGRRRDGSAPAGAFPARPPVIGLLPGSRKSEAQANFPGLLEAARLVRRAFPDARFLVPTTPATHPVVKGLLDREGWPATAVAEPAAAAAGAAGDPPGAAAADPLGADPLPSVAMTYGLNCFDEMVPRCDLCLTVSGTATLHVAAFGVPMIVVYRINRAAWNLAGRWLVPTRTFALVNVLASRRGQGNGTAAPPAGAAPAEGRLVPEFVPWYGDGRPLAGMAIDYLRHPEKLAGQRRELRRLIEDLDRPGASMEVARMVLGMAKSSAPRAAAPAAAG